VKETALPWISSKTSSKNLIERNIILSQIRLYFCATKTLAETYYQALDVAFEDDAYPIAITEINEDKKLFEIALYTDEAEGESVLQEMASILKLAPSAIQVEKLPDIDWVKHSLEGLKPVRAGRFFVHGHHDKDKRQPGDLSIEIEAGMAFGTGHHGTTAGCLEMINKVMLLEQPKTALDLGTGSGVLAIAMAKLSSIKIIASDIDPLAADTARKNVELNNVSSSVDVITATGFRDTKIENSSPYDLIVANILATPLIELAGEIACHLVGGGSIILSGILDSQREKVLAAYQDQGFQHCDTLHREGWVTLHLKR